MQKAAIVILNYNGKGMLQQFLPDVVKYSRYEVIVADNGSFDGSLDFVRDYFPGLKTILLDKNYGYSQGYNLALDRLRGKYEYYILLNSDVLVTGGWDEKMIQWMDSRPDVAAAQPKMLSHQRTPYFDYSGAGGGFLDSLGYPFCRGRLFNRLEKDEGQYDDRISVDWASGACFFIRSEDFHKAGGFDNAFFAHMEEIDLCWRLRLSGRKVFYNGAVEVYHLNGGTLPSSSPLKTFLNFRNNLLMLYKNHSKTDFLGVFAVRLLFDLAAGVHFVLTEGWSHGQAVVKAYFDFFKKRKSVQRTLPLASKLTKDVQEKKVRSIVLSYYLGGKRSYEEL